MGLSGDEFSRRARVGHRLLLQPDAVGPGLLSLVQGLDQPPRRQDRDDSSSRTFGRESVKRSRRIYLCGYGLARRMADLKTITDTVHGTIRLDPLTLDLLETLELQRLNSIRQLGLTYLVFPGANHSRVEHCLGVGHVAGEVARALSHSGVETLPRTDHPQPDGCGPDRLPHAGRALHGRLPRDDRLLPPPANAPDPQGRARLGSEGPSGIGGDARRAGPDVLLRVLPQDRPHC